MQFGADLAMPGAPLRRAGRRGMNLRAVYFAGADMAFVFTL